MATNNQIHPVYLTSGYNDTDGSTFSTGAFVATVGRTVVVVFLSKVSANANPSEPSTVTGHDMTWTKAATSAAILSATSGYRISAWYAYVVDAADAASDTVDFDFGAETETAFQWIVVELPFVTSTSPVVQTKTYSNAGSGTTVTITLDAALSNSMNVLLSAIEVPYSGTPTVDVAGNQTGIIVKTSMSGGDACSQCVGCGVGITVTYAHASIGGRAGIAIEWAHDGTGVSAGGGGNIIRVGMSGGMT